MQHLIMVYEISVVLENYKEKKPLLCHMLTSQRR